MTHGRLYRDGRLLVPHEASGVAERRRLSFAGIVSVAIVLSDSGDVLEDPTVALLGIPEADAEGAASARSSRRRSTRRSTRCRSRAAATPRLVREAVRRAVRGEIDAAWGKKPQTIVHVAHVSD